MNRRMFLEKLIFTQDNYKRPNYNSEDIVFDNRCQLLSFKNHNGVIHDDEKSLQNVTEETKSQETDARQLQ